MKRVCCLVLCIALCFSLCACKSEAVKAAEAAISAIGTVTLESKEKITAAEELYNALPSDEQGQVGNYDVLEAALETWDDLAVKNVESLIGAIGTVTLESGEKVEAARAAYDALPAYLQEKVVSKQVLENAEADYEQAVKVDANTIKNYEEIRASSPEVLDKSADEWYASNDSRATLLVLFLLTGITDEQIDSDEMDLGNQYAAICKADNRIDMYAPYGDGQVMGIQYWPEKNKAQIGTVKTELEITEYLDLMKDAGVVDSYREIPATDIVTVINILGEYM